ncbi:MAG: hypothetical protein KC766_31080, partial [Myxococcales bacterium]|nr:hypothetical protein [Myxococcales bacterium]
VPDKDKQIGKLAFSANGELIAGHVIDSKNDANALHVWSVASGQPVGQFPWQSSTGNTRSGNDIYFLPGDRHCLFLHQGRLQQADLRTMRSQPFAAAADLDPNLRRLALTSRHGCVALYTEQNELIIVQPHPWRVLSRFMPPKDRSESDFVVAPQGNVMAWCKSEFVLFGFNNFASEIEVWTPRTKAGKPVATVKMKQDARVLIFSPDSALLVVGGINRKVQLLGVAEPKKARVPQE